MFRKWAAVIVLFSLSIPAGAQEFDTATGRRIAQTVCAECHQVDANPATNSPNPAAPRFADVARMPSTTELAIRVFLSSPHSSMPDIILRAEEIDSITAYILGFANK